MKSWCLLSLSVLLFGACKANSTTVDAGAMVSWLDGSIALQNSSGNLSLGGQRNDLDGDLGMGSTQASPYLRVQWDGHPHRVRAHGFGYDANNTGRLTGDYGNIGAGASVSTSIQYLATAASYSYALTGSPHYRVGVGGQLAYYLMNAAVRTGGLGGTREEVETDVLVPMPFVEAEFYFRDAFTVGGNLGYMSADLGDAKGHYTDLELWGKFQATKKLDLLFGYRFIAMDGRGQASTRDFDADLHIQGLFVGGGIRF
jgi:hypothetical protein